MFCGFCGNQGQGDSQIVIRDQNASMISQRVSRSNRSEMLNIMHNVTHYSMIRPSKYDQYHKNCKQNKVNFEDPQFDKNSSTIGVAVNNRRIIWKRVGQVVKNAVMIEKDIEPGDVQQGNVGDCYFLAAISSIAEDSDRIRKIFCNDQMVINQYGIYRLVVACQGVLKEIVIDDYIPVFEGSDRPVFCKPKNNQIWVMLLEKAWAKLSGSYGNTSSGYPHEVLNTFLEAPCFYIEMPITMIKSEEQKNDLWRYIMNADHRNYVMCAGSRQAHICQGIKHAHTYSLLACYQVKVEGKTYRLIKLRNPWGDTQYEGKYSEKDKAFWSQVDPMIKLAIFKKRNEDDGIFTMQLTQFVRNFESLDISYYQKDYNYIFQKIQVETNTPFYFDFQVSSQIQGNQFFFTIEKSFDRNAYVKQRRVDYGYSKLLISEVKERYNEEGKLQKQFFYVSSKLETNFPDLTVECSSLKKGKYIIYGETSFPNNSNGSITLSVYSKAEMNIQKIPPPDKYFLHKVFLDHANKYQENRMDILGSQNDWTTSKFLFENGGFGYIVAELGKNSKNKIKIVCDVKKVYDSGFLILERGIKKPEGLIEIFLEEEKQGILIFAINFARPIREIDFPPKGVKITRIV